ncbi:Sec-independent protein translocase protein TatB [Hyphomicrobium sp.]|uniref:Sec-independent protein translocase protein TatB n=1 Tax=Hyphomicrobium sp. TaxID=82 RepID=UPI0025C2AAB6|nr:Sec-independent protein translocase protein TatB [Hyphomicrobium sp.]MCC7251564.1 twin-arginine translocase subunit TatB [Hyphomicrobium sp.]
MFDISWSELLILGLVTLIFVGPKELPRFLNTLGRYAGVVRRQANEFRAVFEQAMREAELDQIKKEVQAVSEGVKSSLDEATRSVESVKASAKIEPEAKLETKSETTPKALAAEPSAAPEATSPEPDQQPVPAGEADSKSTVGST